MTTKFPSKRPLPNGYISKEGHEGYDEHDNFQSPQSYMNPSPKALHVRVHVNNDKFEPGKKMTVATNKLKTFENFLQECTERIKPPFGAARRLYTARGRHRIQQLDELTEDSIYVITGYEKYKAQNYRGIPEQTRPPRRKGFKKIDYDKIYTPVTHATEERFRKQLGRAYNLNDNRKGLRLRVHVNGSVEKPSRLVKVQYNDRDNFPKILAEIEDAMCLQPIQRLYKVINQGGLSENFIEVREASELDNNEHILVLPKNKSNSLLCKFYSCEGMADFKVATSPRAGTYHLYPSFQDGRVYKHDKNLNRHRLLPSIGSSKKSDSMSPYSNTPGSQRGGRNHVKSKGTREVDYDREDGLYRAKRRNNPHGAHQVNESKQTHTEKPIDQMKAEIVEEEEIYTKGKTTPTPADTELNKQPSKETKQNEQNASLTKNTTEERDEDAVMNRIDEYEDDSFNQFDRNTSGAVSKDPRSSTPASRDEAKRKQEQKEYEAATKIQAGVRGYRARKSCKAKREAIKQEQEESRHRDDAQRQEDVDAQERAEKKRMNEDAAATKVQAAYRAYNTRKEYKNKKGQK